jgi:hypothetical protein
MVLGIHVIEKLPFQDVRGEVTGVVLPVLAALAGWLAVMYGIQHAMIDVPFLTGVTRC